MNEHGFIMFNRADETIELLRDPYAFALLGLIAQRARWRTLPDGLELGESLLGDCERFGMTRSIYRRALRKLVKWRQITIRTTNKGTIAKLISSLVFDINLTENDNPESHPERQQNANGKPSENHPKTNGEPLTNKERRKEGEQGKKETRKLSIWEAKERIAAINKEIEDVESNYHNWLYRLCESGEYVSYSDHRPTSTVDKRLKPEAMVRLTELIEKRKETEPFLKGV
jgi:hypothetical protein